ncbi:hypothetical protein BT96DRAFT_571589 [Gymnopus androsaceus JB14]|uniref:Uncharacterized protein n=1 Tax=Gymnopus androsaceus JB14 TaxID=1447944 RepID=A0A6A4GJW6_9AGAR|nr:hypothetical protein BT96DRAFT_571589 [Gymnopus androsaceus JB14]
MSNTIQTSADLPKMYLKFNMIKLNFDHSPDGKKIYITISDNKVGSESKIKTKICPGKMEMIWVLTQTSLVMDMSSSILVEIKRSHRVKHGEIMLTLLLECEEIFEKLVQSNTNAGSDCQEFTLSNPGITMVLSISSESLDTILKEFVPPKNIFGKMRKYEEGLDFLFSVAEAVGSLHPAAQAVIGSAKSVYEVFKAQGKCHESISKLFESMTFFLSIVQGAGPIKDQSERMAAQIDSIIELIGNVVDDVLIKCNANMLRKLPFSAFININ